MSIFNNQNDLINERIGQNSYFKKFKNHLDELKKEEERDKMVLTQFDQINSLKTIVDNEN